MRERAGDEDGFVGEDDGARERRRTELANHLGGIKVSTFGIPKELLPRFYLYLLLLSTISRVFLFKNGSFKNKNKIFFGFYFNVRRYYSQPTKFLKVKPINQVGGLVPLSIASLSRSLFTIHDDSVLEFRRLSVSLSDSVESTISLLARALKIRNFPCDSKP